MTVGTGAIAARPAAPSRLIAGSEGFNWAFALLATWPVSGAYLDGWAHRHVPSLETFFTPWHAVLYSGVAVCLLFLGTVYLWNQAHGASWQRALPAGYGLSLIGVVLFGIGGVLDLGWHTLFGIERNVSALLSPTHLVLMASMALIVTGPLRAVGLTAARRATWPAVVSATLLLSGFTFFTQFNNPLINQWATNPRAFSEQEGIAGVIIYAGLLSAVVLLLVQRFLLPLGAITLMFTLNAIFVTGLVGFDRIIVLCAFNGFVADLALMLLRTDVRPAGAFRSFAAFVPGFFFLTSSWRSTWWTWCGGRSMCGPDASSAPAPSAGFSASRSSHRRRSAATTANRCGPAIRDGGRSAGERAPYTGRHEWLSTEKGMATATVSRVSTGS